MKLVYIVFSNRQSGLCTCYSILIYTSIKFQKYIVTTPRMIKENKQTKTEPQNVLGLSHDNPTNFFFWMAYLVPNIVNINSERSMDQPTYMIVWYFLVFFTQK